VREEEYGFINVLLKVGGLIIHRILLLYLTIRRGCG
jgi:hypothetical protein